MPLAFSKTSSTKSELSVRNFDGESAEAILFLGMKPNLPRISSFVIVFSAHTRGDSES